MNQCEFVIAGLMSLIIISWLIFVYVLVKVDGYDS